MEEYLIQTGLTEFIIFFTEFVYSRLDIVAFHRLRRGGRSAA